MAGVSDGSQVPRASALERCAICPRFDDLGADGAPARLGIMGGTFDPIHIGHLAVAEQAREAFGLAAVVFIPAGVPVFKLNRRVAPAEDRLEMCRRAVEDNPRFDVSGIEVRRAGNTYTVDTLRQMRAHYSGNVEFHFIIGADALASIGKWRESAEVARLASIIAVTRPGFALDDQVRAEAEAGGFRVGYLQATALSVSSSQLREMLEQGRSIRYLTPDSVCGYIRERGLYGFGAAGAQGFPQAPFDGERGIHG